MKPTLARTIHHYCAMGIRELGRSGRQNALQSADLAVRKIGEVARPAILADIRRVRRQHPDATPQEVIRRLGRQFSSATTATGAGVGAVAAVPAVGTGPALVLSGGEFVTYSLSAAAYVLAVAEIHGIDIDQIERRRTLVMGVLLGDAGSKTVERVAQRTGSHWGRQVVAKVPVATLRSVNKVLGRNFVTKYGTQQGILVLGRAVPFGIGALIGGAGNYGFSQFTIRSTQRAFGDPPTQWHPDLDDETRP
jgi:hypothetical protein